MKRVREKCILDISQGEFLMLLFVAEAKNNSPRGLVIDWTRQESLHLLIDVLAILQDFFEGWSRETSAQFFFRNVLAKRVVVTVEEPAEIFTQRFKVVQEWRGTNVSKNHVVCG